jgi:hypothetical protein
MLNLKTIASLAKGALGPDELAELLSQLGWKIQLQAVRDDFRELPFREAAAAAVQPGSSMVSLKGQNNEGQRVHMIMIMEEAVRALPESRTPKVTAQPKKLLDTGQAVA